MRPFPGGQRSLAMEGHEMNKHLFAFSACLVALTFVATGCLEVKQDFEVHGDGSGIVEIEFKVGKEMSGMVSSRARARRSSTRSRPLSWAKTSAASTGRS